MNIVHAYIKLEDQFSGALDHRIVTVSQDKFDKMRKNIGATFNQFSNHINWTWKVLDVQQATSEHYKLAKVPEFVNQP